MRVTAFLFEPEFNLFHVRLRLRRFVLELLETDAHEGDVIHFCRAWDSSPMFEMAGGARRDVGVKGGRLALKDGFVVGVADDAIFRLNALHRCVARRTVVLKKGVRLRECAWHDHVLPGDWREDRARRFFPMKR